MLKSVIKDDSFRTVSTFLELRILMGNVINRNATSDDIDALVAIEEMCFDSDRISRRSFRTLITRPTARTIVAELDGMIIGYAMIFFRKGTALARLYSLAVKPHLNIKGAGTKLLEAAEKAAFDEGRIYMRLEVREDNVKAIALYERLHYRPIGRYLDYYADHTPALRYEKTLRGSVPVETSVPYYQQTADFTCGAACLMMALKYFNPQSRLDPVFELRLWRGATTIYMLSGPGGCEPFGLAVLAHNYGLKATIVVSSDEFLFLNSVRNPQKRKVMELVQTDFREQAATAHIPVRITAFTLDDIRTALARGAVVMVLISFYHMFGEKIPHWVLVHGDDGSHFLIHDPWVEEEEGETIADSANLPLNYKVFDRIARFGKDGLRAAVILEKS